MQTSEQAAPLPFTAPATARQMYQAARAYREVLGDQLSRLQNKRNDITRELTNEETKGVDRAGLEARLKDVDARILEMDKQIATADGGVAKAALTPGATADPPRPRQPFPTDDQMAFGAFSLVVLAMPIVIAYSRRIWRRSAKVTVALPAELAGRMQAMEEAIESVAVEVERIGEGQRFVTQALSSGGAEALIARQREPVHAHRPL